MNDRDLLIVLGNQLFPINYIKNTRSKHIFMAEDYDLCTDYKHHKLKILFFFLAMREYRNNLITIIVIFNIIINHLHFS